jgi:hypothetical protein
MPQKSPQPVPTAWQHLYSAALLELNRDRLRSLIEQTEQAIADRYRSLGPALDADEVRRMADAIWNLSVLRHEALQARSEQL